MAFAETILTMLSKGECYLVTSLAGKPDTSKVQTLKIGLKNIR
jgi:hypothetical protein